MNRFELGLLYKNDTGNIILSISQNFTYEDEKESILSDLKNISILIDNLSSSPVKDILERIKELKEEVNDLNNTIKDLNTDIDISLDENSTDYVNWLETKIMN